nr:RNA-directed DNA polymerase, eukaryota [Tanacetum cinerariifolium]
MGKLKFLKNRIKEWNASNMNRLKNAKAQHKKDLEAVDAKIDEGKGDEEDIRNRMEIINSLKRYNKLESTEIAQKAKIKWAVEGDENSRFFHGMLNKRRNTLNIRGVLVDGVWTDSPNKELECEVSNEEIKRAVWEYGTDKAPGPDGFTFGFFRIFGILLTKMYMKLSICSFILNEVLKWCKVKKKQALIFKVDFEKAYDSVRWDFLDDVLYKFGFGDKWRKWIQCCLRSSKGSIIVNGSPTEEFQFGMGLKQGEPLSSFLFILIMENLHLSFQRVVDAGMFQAIKLDASVNLSHMFYADDAVFVGHWNDSNITTLVHLLECFFRASGIKINMGKSKIMGVHVENAKVSRAAVKLGCLVLKAPFVYLGAIVGGNMNKLHAWNDIVDRIKRRLSKWKMTSLSIGAIFLMVMIFRVRKLYGFAGKRFLNHDKSLWASVIKAIHGVDGNIGKCSRTSNKSCWENILNEVKVLSNKDIDLLKYTRIRLGDGESMVFWEDYWNEGGKLKDLFPRLYNLETSKGITVGRKLAQPNLIYSFRRTPRGGAERVQMEELEMLINSVRLTPMADRLIWTLDSAGIFSMASHGRSFWSQFMKDAFIKSGSIRN